MNVVIFSFKEPVFLAIRTFNESVQHVCLNQNFHNLECVSFLDTCTTDPYMRNSQVSNVARKCEPQALLVTLCHSIQAFLQVICPWHFPLGRASISADNLLA